LGVPTLENRRDSGAVYELSKALARKGVEVHVVTPELKSMMPYKSCCNAPGVHLHRIAMDFNADFIWLMNLKMVEVASQMDFDLLHAHDWMVCDAALELRSRLRKPLVSTMHSTEFGRRHKRRLPDADSL